MNRNTVIAAVIALAVAGGVFMLLNKKPETVTPTAPSNTAIETSTGAPSMPVATAPIPRAAPAVSIDPAQVQPVASGAPLDMSTVALEAKMISNAQNLLNQGKPREALKQIEEYEQVPDRAALVPEAKWLKIQALGTVGGRRTDALALAMTTRTDPTMAPYQKRIEDFLADAGISGGTTYPSP